MQRMEAPLAVSVSDLKRSPHRCHGARRGRGGGGAEPQPGHGLHWSRPKPTRRCWSGWTTWRSSRSRASAPTRSRCASRSMSYELAFLPSALREWNKLGATLRAQFKKKAR